ncbi:hypothetical protein [Clostridium paridis]|uniref:Tetratricopeptide repeat protein n=1 Tax=Clostridium paridis TaxID=2803863 RepID=A0A937FI17_9CLOT|nr:hypothetical protein [Clostridium paridis]MBL4931921.1 hypothetical protein [Clostridium paridis]
MNEIEIKKQIIVSSIIAKYKRGNYIINGVFLIVIICVAIIAVLKTPIEFTFPVFTHIIKLSLISGIIIAVLKISIKYIRILLLKRILLEECAAKKYFEIMNGVYRSERKKVYREKILFEMIYGSIYSGNFNGALELLLSGKIDTKKLRKQDLLNYYVYLADCYYSLGNIDEFLKAKSTAEKITDNKKYSVAEKINNQIKIIVLKGDLAFYNNDFKESRELFQEALLNVSSKLNKIVIIYKLSLIDIKEGMLEGAKEKLEFVINHGNEIYQVNEAKEQIRLISVKVE